MYYKEHPTIRTDPLVWISVLVAIGGIIGLSASINGDPMIGLVGGIAFGGAIAVIVLRYLIAKFSTLEISETTVSFISGITRREENLNIRVLDKWNVEPGIIGIIFRVAKITFVTTGDRKDLEVRGMPHYQEIKRILKGYDNTGAY